MITRGVSMEAARRIRRLAEVELESVRVAISTAVVMDAALALSVVYLGVSLAKVDVDPTTVAWKHMQEVSKLLTRSRGTIGPAHQPCPPH